MTTMKDDGTVSFRFFKKDAASVAVAGDFNGWQPEGLLMEADAQQQGWWSIEMKLGPGEYRFRYFCDGRWFTDFASHGVELHKREWNSVLVVPDRFGALAA